MEISLIWDNVTAINIKHHHGLGFANSSTRRHNLTPSSPDQQRRLEIRVQRLPIDAVAPPPVKPNTIPKTRIRKRSRVRRRQKDENFGAGQGGNGGGFFSGGGNGPFGGGGNDGNGGFNWDESSPFPSDPAFDFVYEALSWFVLSNCLYFAFKRVVRIVVEGSADPGDRRFR
ncbi:hypothetical protein R6Q59_022110 [Mikania micrantha]|uniref:Uncharacterized protein n=1 Tax=Mikania micrantha TaxID=192012 RepID=A0A5N6MVQ6_9ASTR|nr:hypothetical protein E3N88_27104 [Mikania micrantha]